MRRRHHALSRTALALLLALALPGAALAAGQVGEIAADFTLPAAQGGSYTFSDYDGLVRFLFFTGHS